MKINTVETLPSSGALTDPFYKFDGSKESITLDWSYVNNSFAVVDRNIDYSKLPFQMGNGLVKKVFLTYNSISCQTKEVIETVVMESSNTADPTGEFNPNYNNSNEWTYQPANFRVPADLYGAPSNDLLSWPYPFTEGITLIKQFLNSQGNLNPPLYTAYYRRPTMTFYEIANVEGSKVFTDGWYTSYVIAAKTYDLMQPNPNTPNSSPAGIIIFNNTDDKFYINLTGTCLAIDLINFTHLPQFDTTNWQADPSFSQWMTFLKNNYSNSFNAGGQNQNNPYNGTLAPNLLNGGYNTQIYNSTNTFNNTGVNGVDSPANTVTPLNQVFYSECNHLATPELNAVILKELKRLCGCCHEDKFNMSHIETWIKLRGKQEAAFTFFNEENFKSAQEVIISSRAKCHSLLYDSDNCNFNYTRKCS